MGTDTRHRERFGQKNRPPVDAGGEQSTPATAGEVKLPKLPSLEALRATLARNDGRISVAEQYELRLAVELLGAIEFTDAPPDQAQAQTQAVPCAQCERPCPPVGLPLPALCTDCCWWHLMARIIARVPDLRPDSIRYRGHSYLLDPTVEEGPLMTIRGLEGTVIVTHRLRGLGRTPIPTAPDNCLIVVGNPANLPLGIHAPAVAGHPTHPRVSLD